MSCPDCKLCDGCAAMQEFREQSIRESQHQIHIALARLLATAEETARVIDEEATNVLAKLKGK